MRNYYRDRVWNTLVGLADGHTPAVDPRHVEAYMRLGTGGTLDHLDPVAWELEVNIGAACALRADPDARENLARSYGL